MKNYMVLVESEDYITVDADSEDDAERQAIDIFVNNSPVHDCKATVLHVTDPEEPEAEPCDIPY